MGKVNIWLKRSYIGVISLIALISILLLGLTLFVHGFVQQREEMENLVPGLHFLYGFSATTLLFMIFGGFGVWKQKKWALIVFAVGMILSGLYLFACEVNVLVVKPQLEKYLKEHYLNLLPQTAHNETGLVNRIQIKFQCCGVESYMDWKNKIPESCLCTDESTNPCVAAPRDTNLFVEGKNVMIYAKPCLPLIVAYDLHGLHVISGILIAFILLWVLSAVLSIAILCQMDRKVETPKVFYSSEAKAGNYSCLTETPDSDQT